MNGSDSGAGEHRIGRFRNHGHVNTNPVAFPTPRALERLTGGIQPHADPGSLFEILIWLIAFPDYCGLVATFFQVSINTVIAGVKFRAAEPGRSGGGEIAQLT